MDNNNHLNCLANSYSSLITNRNAKSSVKSSLTPPGPRSPSQSFPLAWPPIVTIIVLFYNCYAYMFLSSPASCPVQEDGKGNDFIRKAKPHPDNLYQTSVYMSWARTFLMPSPEYKGI